MIGVRSEAVVEASCWSAASVTATPHSLQSYVCNSASPSAWEIALANRIGLPQLGQAGMRSPFIWGRVTQVHSCDEDHFSARYANAAAEWRCIAGRLHPSLSYRRDGVCWACAQEALAAGREPPMRKGRHRVPLVASQAQTHAAEDSPLREASAIAPLFITLAQNPAGPRILPSGPAGTRCK